MTRSRIASFQMVAGLFMSLNAFGQCPEPFIFPPCPNLDLNAYCRTTEVWRIDWVASTTAYVSPPPLDCIYSSVEVSSSGAGGCVTSAGSSIYPVQENIFVAYPSCGGWNHIPEYALACVPGGLNDNSVLLHAAKSRSTSELGDYDDRCGGDRCFNNVTGFARATAIIQTGTAPVFSVDISIRELTCGPVPSSARKKRIGVIPPGEAPTPPPDLNAFFTPNGNKLNGFVQNPLDPSEYTATYSYQGVNGSNNIQ